MPRKLIITTDPGQDQAAALMMILGSPDEFEVLGLIATAGNIDLEQTVQNCAKVLELAGRTDIPIYRGCPRPMKRDLVMAEHVHGPTGMDGPDLPAPTMAIQDKHGIDFLIDTIRSEPVDSITICSLSPLTNLGMVLVKAPDIVLRVRDVVMMAGAYFEGGNITPTAEFNVFVDPDAADIVLRSGMEITMVPLDVTHQMLSTPERLDRMRQTGTCCGIATAEMLEFSQTFDLAKYGWPGAPLHGPCVPAFMMRPDLFEGRQINVTVETSSSLSLGMTVADWWRITDDSKNVFYVRHGDSDGYYDLLINSLENLP